MTQNLQNELPAYLEGADPATALQLNKVSAASMYAQYVLSVRLIHLSCVAGHGRGRLTR